MLEAIEKMIEPLLNELTNKVADACPDFSLDKLKQKIEPLACELQTKVVTAVISGKDISDEVIPAVTAVVTDLYGNLGDGDDADDEDDL